MATRWILLDELEQAILGFLGPVRFHQGQVGQRRGFPSQGHLHDQRFIARLTRGFLVQFGGLGELSGRFAGFGKLERGRLAVIADREDLVGRDSGYGGCRA